MKRNLLVAGAASAALIASVAWAQSGQEPAGTMDRDVMQANNTQAAPSDRMTSGSATASQPGTANENAGMTSGSGTTTRAMTAGERG